MHFYMAAVLCACDERERGGTRIVCVCVFCVLCAHLIHIDVCLQQTQPPVCKEMFVCAVCVCVSVCEQQYRCAKKHASARAVAFAYLHASLLVLQYRLDVKV